MSYLYKKMVPEKLLQDCFPVCCLREPCSSAGVMQRHQCPQSAFPSSHRSQFLLSPTPAKLLSLCAQDFPSCDPQIVLLFYVTLLFLLHPSFTHSCFFFLLSSDCVFLPTLSHCWLCHPTQFLLPQKHLSHLYFHLYFLFMVSYPWHPRCRATGSVRSPPKQFLPPYGFVFFFCAFFSPKQNVSAQIVHKVIILSEFVRL